MSKVTLGASTPYESLYNPQLLQPLPRQRPIAPGRMYGEDIWTAYELSWLDSRGQPEVAIAEFRIPAASDHLVESKSLKYYLNSFNQTRINTADEVRDLLLRDLSAATGAEVSVRLFSFAEFNRWRQAAKPMGESLDAYELQAPPCYEPGKPVIRLKRSEAAQQVWVSDLLKSNCPVTGQPDWASIWFGFTGVEANPEDLLRYVISFREHQGFHESCVERMFLELMETLEPTELWVYARYTRRGGLDINPFRSTRSEPVPHLWGIRQ